MTTRNIGAMKKALYRKHAKRIMARIRRMKPKPPQRCRIRPMRPGPAYCR